MYYIMRTYMYNANDRRGTALSTSEIYNDMFYKLKKILLKIHLIKGHVAIGYAMIRIIKLGQNFLEVACQICLVLRSLSNETILQNTNEFVGCSLQYAT